MFLPRGPISGESSPTRTPKESIMGLLDVLNGMQSGPRGPQHAKL
ncbi:hypothetical protein ACVWZZ_003710 [Bradyrhizobium sp. LM6.10]